MFHHMNKHTDTYAAADDLLPIGEAAKVAHCSIDTMRRWENAGAIAAVRTPGGQRRFRRSDVEALVGVTDE